MVLYVIDLFCGAGGFSTGAKQAGAKIAIAIDTWDIALDVHKHNHPNTKHLNMELGGKYKHGEEIARVIKDVYDKQNGSIIGYIEPFCADLEHLLQFLPYPRYVVIYIFVFVFVNLVYHFTRDL